MFERVARARGRWVIVVALDAAVDAQATSAAPDAAPILWVDRCAGNPLAIGCM